MLIAILVIQTLILALSLVLLLMQQRDRGLRAAERLLQLAAAERADLIDRVMVMKGFRDYLPSIPTPENEGKEDLLSALGDWESDRAGEGFQPFG